MDTTCTRLHENLMHFIIILWCAVEKKLRTINVLERDSCRPMGLATATVKPAHELACSSHHLRAPRRSNRPECTAGPLPAILPLMGRREGDVVVEREEGFLR